MFLQQSAQLSVLRLQRSLCVIHTAMIVDREQARQVTRSGSAYRHGQKPDPKLPGPGGLTKMGG